MNNVLKLGTDWFDAIQCFKNYIEYMCNTFSEQRYVTSCGWQAFIINNLSENFNVIKGYETDYSLMFKTEQDKLYFILKFS